MCVYGWWSKLWSPFGSPKYYPKGTVVFDNHPYIYICMVPRCRFNSPPPPHGMVPLSGGPVGVSKPMMRTQFGCSYHHLHSGFNLTCGFKMAKIMLPACMLAPLPAYLPWDDLMYLTTAAVYEGLGGYVGGSWRPVRG